MADEPVRVRYPEPSLRVLQEEQAAHHIDDRAENG